MTQYGADVTQSDEIPTYNTPKQGVGKAPAFLQGVADTLNIGAEMFGDIKKKKESTALDELAKTQLKIADSYAQGGIKTAAAAKMRLRANLMDAIEAGIPAVEAMKLQASLNIMGGLEIVDEGTLAEQRELARQDWLVSNNYMSYEDAGDPDKVRQANNKALTSAEAERQFTQAKQTYELAKTSMDFTKAQREEAKRNAEDAADNFVKTEGTRLFGTMKSRFDQILVSDYAESEKVEMIEDTFLSLQSEMTGVLGDLDSFRAGLVMKNFEQLKTVYSERARGTESDAELTRVYERTMQVNKNIMILDPEMGKRIALSDAVDLGFLGDQFAVGTVKRWEQLYGGGLNADTTVDPYQTSRDELPAMELFFESIDQGFSPKATPAEREQAVKVFDNYLGSMDDFHTRIRKNPEKAIKLVEAMAGNKFYNIVKNGDFNNLQDAGRVISDYYSNEVWQMVQKQFKDSNINMLMSEAQDRIASTGKPLDLSTSGNVAFRTTSSGVEFYAIDPTVGNSKAKARQLNKDLAPIINTTVRAEAHLQGRNDYGKVWEETYKKNFSSDIITDEGDDLTIQSFDDNQQGSMGDDMIARLPSDVQQDTEFLTEVDALAGRLKVNPSHLMTLFDFETGGDFGTGPQNPRSSATGLIGFMRDTAKGLGTSVEALSSMTRTEQLQWVEKYLKQNGAEGKGLDDLYMAVLWPKAVGKPGDYVLFRQGSAAYRDNRELDKNGTGTVTKDEVAAIIRRRAKKYENQ